MYSKQLITFLHLISVIAYSLCKHCSLRLYGDGNDRYLPSFVTSTEDKIGFQQCMALCYMKTNCHVINYNKTALKCEMKSITGPLEIIDNLIERRQGSVNSIVKKPGSSEDEVSCTMLKCPPNTICVKLHGGTTICHPEQCQREDYTLSSKLNFCFKIHHAYASYTNAVQTCNTEGATLTVINSEAKKDFLTKQHLVFKYPHRVPIFVAGEKINGFWTLPDNTTLDPSVQWSTVSETFDGPCLILWGVTGIFSFADYYCNNGLFICEERNRI